MCEGRPFLDIKQNHGIYILLENIYTPVIFSFKEAVVASIKLPGSSHVEDRGTFAVRRTRGFDDFFPRRRLRREARRWVVNKDVQKRVIVRPREWRLNSSSSITYFL